jgi:hypothetical protein
MQISNLYTTTKEAVLSVALPCYNGQQIAWLCLESLCRQETAPAWELIICEEPHDNMIGQEVFESYVYRLAQANCVRVVYIKPSEWIPLIDKWILIGQHISETSKVFTLQAIDCYTPSKRLELSYDFITNKKCDWVDFSKGYFYSFTHNKVILYATRAKTNLHMSFHSKYAKNIPTTHLRRGIDGWLHKHVKNNSKRRIHHKVINTLLEDGIDTDGFNNISLNRNNKYEYVTYPFIPANKTIEQLPLPAEVIERIKTML